MVVPLMAISKSLALAKESVLAVTSVPLKVGFTALVEAPGSSNNVPPPVLIPPPLIATSPLLISCILVEVGRVTPIPTVMSPAAASPMMSVPVLILSSSESDKIRGAFVPSGAKEISIAAPAVKGFKVTELAELVRMAGESTMYKLLVMILILPPFTSVVILEIGAAFCFVM